MSSSTTTGQAEERRRQLLAQRAAGDEPYKTVPFSGESACGRLKAVSKRADGSRELHIVIDGAERHVMTRADIRDRVDALKRGDVIACALCVERGLPVATDVVTTTPRMRRPVAVKTDAVASMLLDPAIASRLRARSKIVSAMRRHLESLDFTEVETRVAHPLGHCGAAAKPMIVHRAQRTAQLTLRVATEVELKRLVIGGMDRVFEIGRVFRDEGDDDTHQPEFTSLELYQSHLALGAGIKLATSLMRIAVSTVEDSPLREYPFRVATMRELVSSAGVDVISGAEPSHQEISAVHGIVAGATSYGAALESLFDKLVAPGLTGVTVVAKLPRSSSPMSRPCSDQLADRFELYVDDVEIMNGCAEQTDPDALRAAMSAQPGGLTQLGDQLCRDTELGMPPTFGLGIGVDRLVAAILGERKITSVMALR